VPNQIRHSPSQPLFDTSLEALRGIAALLVVLTHALSDETSPDAHYHTTGIWQYTPPGHLCVLVFFLLSGYVIGLTNMRPILTNSARKLYLKKRLVRLYPLYLVSLIVTVAVAAIYGKFYGLKEIGGWLLFLQGRIVGVPAYNTPIWSLGYEILYYAFFLIVSAQNWRAEWVAACFFLLGLSITQIPGAPLILVSYSYGAVFWFLGMFLTRMPRRSNPPEYGTMLAFLLLLLSYARLNLVVSLVSALHLNITEEQAPLFERIIIFSDFTSLLYCIPLLLCFTNRSFPGRKWLERTAFAIPAFYIVAYVTSGKILKPELFNTSFIAMVCYVLAVGVYITRSKITALGEKAIKWFTPLGLISYGIYIIHYPLLFVFRDVASFSGTAPTLILRLMVYLAIAFGLGWLLEIKFQPWIKHRLM
jgi:peptidoglycan/LPS O-acetylase OafA/YrhL